VFTSSEPFLVFDHLRVPYEVNQDQQTQTPDEAAGLRWGRLTACGTGSPVLMWPVLDATEAERTAPIRRPGRFLMGDLVLHGRLVPDEVLTPALPASAGTWLPYEPLRAGDGTVLGSVWHSSDGSIAVPFDPAEVVTRFWSERYVDPHGTHHRARTAVLGAYYAVRPVLPRRVQIALRRAISRVQRRRSFPRWPVEESLHTFLDLVLGWAGSLVGRPVPWIAPWPAGRTWALVLTHDVETAAGVCRIPVLRDIDRRAGHRGSWNLVPRRYSVDDALVAELQAGGLEVGVHGLYHDGRDLDPREFPHRLPQMRAWAERWGAVGFRSPATHRDWDLMSALPFEYDSSSPDSDPFEPQPGGCCSWLPFFVGPVVELPITLPQDHTLYVILRARDGQPWIDKAEHIRARGGLALLVTHPDYVDAAPTAAAYEQLLAHFEDDPDVWRALPSEVASWWRRRAASSLTWDGAAWQVTGAAVGEAAVLLTDPSVGPARSPVTRLPPPWSPTLPVPRGIDGDMKGEARED
jgi:hypothetical protein